MVVRFVPATVRASTWSRFFPKDGFVMPPAYLAAAVRFEERAAAPTGGMTVLLPIRARIRAFCSDCKKFVLIAMGTWSATWTSTAPEKMQPPFSARQKARHWYMKHAILSETGSAPQGRMNSHPQTTVFFVAMKNAGFCLAIVRVLVHSLCPMRKRRNTMEIREVIDFEECVRTAPCFLNLVIAVVIPWRILKLR
jgi:hypothetical protein